MTSQSLDQIAHRPAAAVRIGQATAVEQSRAVAEVQAAVFVAQQFPRNVHAAIASMRESCASQTLAEKAFFRFPRGGQNVSGESIHLARELARCWTNVDYGIKELSRNDDIGESEMLAWAWDVQANTRVSNTFIVKHQRDKRGGPEKLVDLRDIYENNANNGARRVREAIFAILPPSFVEEAKALCTKTLKDGGGKPLAQRIADAIAMFATLGVTTDQLAQKLNRPSAQWTEHDVAQLGVTFRSLERGEITRDEEFPAPRVTADEITSKKSTPKTAPKSDAVEDWPPVAPIPGGE
jgi:hypothetical protein